MDKLLGGLFGVGAGIFEAVMAPMMASSEARRVSRQQIGDLPGLMNTLTAQIPPPGPTPFYNKNTKQITMTPGLLPMPSTAAFGSLAKSQRLRDPAAALAQSYAARPQDLSMPKGPGSGGLLSRLFGGG